MHLIKKHIKELQYLDRDNVCHLINKILTIELLIIS